LPQAERRGGGLQAQRQAGQGTSIFRERGGFVQAAHRLLEQPEPGGQQAQEERHRPHAGVRSTEDR
jgi:hypothetical protein